MSNFDQALAYTLANEGTTYVNNPSDKGGPTKFGISFNTYSAMRFKQGLSTTTPDDVAAMSLAQAGAIYRENYWDKLQADNFTNSAVATAIFDASVLNGILTAVKSVQLPLAQAGILGLAADGIIGPKTIAAINQSQQVLVYLSFAMQSRAVSIVQRDATQRQFLRTWLRRACAYLELGL